MIADFIRHAQMTGTIANNTNQLSILTANQFKDLGYTINPNSAGIDRFWQPTGRRALDVAGTEGVTVLTGCMNGFKGMKYPKPLLVLEPEAV